MPTPRPHVFSREFTETAVQRIAAGEKVRAVATEREVWPSLALTALRMALTARRAPP